jgi:hypothetical protein
LNNRIDLRNCVVTIRDGLKGTAACAKKTSEKWTITLVAPYTGTWTILADTASTNDITGLASAAVVQSKLEAVDGIGEGNVSVSLAGLVYTVELIGALVGTNPVTAFTTVVTELGGGSATPAQTVTGGTPVIPIATDTSVDIDTVAITTAFGTQAVPMGAKFTIALETAETVHTVTGRTPDDNVGPTTSITFSPALGAATSAYSATAVLTFAGHEIAMKMGEGDVKWSEPTAYKYLLDRGHLDSVITGDDAPMDLTLGGTFENILSKGNEDITPTEALKGTGRASAWVSTSSDPCEPYCVDIVVLNVPPCGVLGETEYVFPDFRCEKKDYDIKASTVAFSGKCNALEPIITRS